MAKWIYEVAEAVPSSEGIVSKGPTYKSILAKNGYPVLKDVSTLWELFSNSAAKYPNNKMLGRREIVDGKAGPYVWETYSQVYEKTKTIASAIRFSGLEAGGRVGVYGANCPEWVIAMEACNCQSLYCVPLYDTLGAKAIEFIINHAEVSLVIVQQSKLPVLLAGMENCVKNVKTIVSMKDWDEESKSKANKLGMTAYSWDEFLQLGIAKPVEPVPPKPEDYSTIMYTSGTTGDPKGVLLTHRAIVAVIASVKVFTSIYSEKLDEKDVYLSYLPLAHIFDRATEEFFIDLGASIGFSQGDFKLLVDDIEELKPTLFAGVPRVFDRIYSGTKTKVDSGSPIARFLYNFGFNRKLGRLKHGIKHSKASPIFDALVFSKVKGKLGGHVRLIVSGAAPLATHIEEFLRVAMCAPVVQGYGMTETCAASFIAIPDDISHSGKVGPPLPNLEVRLESVPDMKYDATAVPAQGEICIRGPCLFSGYYKRDDLSAETIDADGWFHTGDVGEWQPDGAMKIIDRKKNIFKLSQGEYVAVENLENIYGQTPGIDSVWVYGNSLESSLVAVVVPNEGALTEWASANGMEGDFATICASAEAKGHILAELGKVGKSTQLKGFEMIKAVHLEPVMFDMERDLLTPTFKKKRPQLLQYYKASIDAMYDKLRT